jgi:hypothetical protein
VTLESKIAESQKAIEQFQEICSDSREPSDRIIRLQGLLSGVQEKCTKRQVIIKHYFQVGKATDLSRSWI